jgi:heme A synthase
MRQTARPKALAAFAWATLGYLIMVILWGAYVRATGSGAGCGAHWPLCNGTVVPRAPRLETIIELSHRLTSGLALVLVGGLLVATYRAFAKGHPARAGATVSMALLLLEAAIGAGLVLLELVADNATAMRAVVIALHLVNTFLLLGGLAYTAREVSLGSRGAPRPAAPRAWRGAATTVALIAFLIVGASGAVVALGDTLFPAESLRAGIAQDFSPTAHFLLRLRVVHPLLAIGTSAFILVLAAGITAAERRSKAGRLALVLGGLVLLQVALGFANLLLLAPMWLQLSHLALADAIWVTLVLLALEPSARAARAATRGTAVGSAAAGAPGAALSR